jgi:hypothetical protein
MQSEEKNYYWGKPLIILIALSFAVFLINRSIDFFFHPQIVSVLQDSIFSKDLSTILNSFGNMGEIMTSVLGIEITAVAIIVQLAANKYSSKIMEMIISDRVNFFVVALFVVAGANTILLANTMTADKVPYFSILFTLLMLVFSLTIVIPHFTYVFNFLRPKHFLKEVELESKKLLKSSLSVSDKNLIRQKRNELAYNIDFIGDVALNSVYQSDRAVSLLCLNTFKNILIYYLPFKKNFPEAWFELTGSEHLDPDFANYSEYVMRRIEEEKVLLERKIFRLYEMVFINSKNNQRDIASGVLINSRLIFEQAVAYNDDGVIWTIMQYFNSFLRAAITSRDPRSAFNTLEHYRIMAEKMLDYDFQILLKFYFFFKYYGQEANKYNVFFILETASHDLYQVTKLAYEHKIDNFEKLLELFLTLDEPIENNNADGQQKELSLIGVRIAQAKLAAFFLRKNDIKYAKEVFNDMLVEPPKRIQTIKDIIFTTDTEEFWEITPRGINFYYLSEEDKEALKTFFSWFDLKH